MTSEQNGRIAAAEIARGETVRFSDPTDAVRWLDSPDGPDDDSAGSEPVVPQPPDDGDQQVVDDGTDDQGGGLP